MGDIFKRQFEGEFAEGLSFQEDLPPVSIRVQAPSIAVVFTDGVILGPGSFLQNQSFSNWAHFTSLFFIAQIWMGLCSITMSIRLKDLQVGDAVRWPASYSVSTEIINLRDYYAKVEFFKISISPDPYAVVRYSASLSI